VKELYKRFGIKLGKKEAIKTFKNKVKNIFEVIIRKMDSETETNFVWNVCNKLGLEFDYDLFLYLPDKVYNVIFGDVTKFEEYLLRLQVVINVLWSDEKTRKLSNLLGRSISHFFEDSSLNLGFQIMFYKEKAPQIIPATCKKFEEEVTDTLGLLESKEEFSSILSSYETGLKEFLKAKNKEGLKDVVEDMYGCCDNLVKIFTGDKNKGFQHISDKEVAKTLCINVHQKELYKNLKVWMNKIKHNELSNYDKNDIEMIVSMVSSLIRYVILKKRDGKYETK